MKIKITVLFSLLCLLTQVYSQEKIGFGRNAYVTSKKLDTAEIQVVGVKFWSNDSKISVYFYVNTPGKLNLKLQSALNYRDAEINVSIPELNQSLNVLFPRNQLIVNVADIDVKKPTYLRVDISGTTNKINLQQGYYPDLNYLHVSGPTSNNLHYVKDNFDDHFGRRGPSVHLNYDQPVNNVEWFYNEVTIPTGQDVVGTYAMAIGFGEGYFGMQVNSATERRILFSVWSPQVTDNPKDIKDINRVVLLQKGNGVTIGEFGNEGSGGQSYLVYPWSAATTYRFWLKVTPDGKGKTVYNGYFFDYKVRQWILIASFQRPQTTTYITGPYSFLENFEPNNGYISRKVYYNNQWAVDSNGKRYNIGSARFSYDNTASAKARVDYTAGYEPGNGYFLKNCGFFGKGDDTVSYQQQLKDTNAGQKQFPDFNINNLSNFKDITKKLRNL